MVHGQVDGHASFVKLIAGLRSEPKVRIPCSPVRSCAPKLVVRLVARILSSATGLSSPFTTARLSARLATTTVSSRVLAVLRSLPSFVRTLPAVIPSASLHDLDEPGVPYATVATKILPELQVPHASTPSVVVAFYRSMLFDVSICLGLDLAVQHSSDAPFMSSKLAIGWHPLLVASASRMATV